MTPARGGAGKRLPSLSCANNLAHRFHGYVYSTGTLYYFGCEQNALPEPRKSRHGGVLGSCLPWTNKLAIEAGASLAVGGVVYRNPVSLSVLGA